MMDSNAVEGSEAETQNSNHRAPSPVDDKFTEGVWYDIAAGQFCTIERDDGRAVLCNPDTGEAEYHFGAEGQEFPPEDFTRVPEQAVEHPAEYVQQAISILSSGSSEVHGYNNKSQIGLRYAREQVNIEEQE